MRSSTCLSCDDISLVNGQLSLFTMYCTALKTWPQFSPRESSYEPLQPLSCADQSHLRDAKKTKLKSGIAHMFLTLRKRHWKQTSADQTTKMFQIFQALPPKILKYTKIMFYVTSGINGVLYRVPGRVWHTVQMPPAPEILFKILGNRPIKLC